MGAYVGLKFSEKSNLLNLVINLSIFVVKLLLLSLLRLELVRSQWQRGDAVPSGDMFKFSNEADR